MRPSTRLQAISALLVAVGCGSDNKPLPPPTITSITPNPLCSDGTSFTIVGTGFDPNAEITVDGNPVSSATVTDAMDITVMVATNTASTGSHMVAVTNPDHQAATGTLTGESKPLMFFVDPNVLGANMTARVTIYMSGLTTTVAGLSVQLHSDAMPNTNPSVALTGVAAVVGHQDQVQATVTSGTLGAGTYDVSVTDGVCTATLNNGLTIVSAPDIVITSVNPPFGAPDQDTAITITTSATSYPLTQTPRVFLSTGGTATALSAVSWQSATQVSAVVPKNVLAAGDYDVIVVDPMDATGGHVGVLAAGFHVIASPPVISSVTPQTVISSQTAVLVVAGSGFATGSTPTAWLSECTAPPGIIPPTTPFALPAISGATATQLSVTINASTMAAGVACVLRIINGAPADASKPCPAAGTCLPYADFSAIASVNGSGNLGTWAQSSTSTDLTQLPSARTRLGVQAGHVNSQTRFMYAIGGDDGTEANAKSDVISAQLDALGKMLGWTTQRHAMISPRTGQSTIRIGQFLYAIGGFNGTATVGTVERARILDPLDVPQLPTIDLTPTTTGLAAGTWVYRVAAVRPATYASDPGGETLPSDPLNVTLPDLTTMSSTPLVKVTLSWPAMASAASYNVYRTSAVGQGATQVQFIANVPQPAGATVTFDDTGLTPTSQTPLPIGSLGTWNAVSNLTTPRFGTAAAIAHGATTATTDTWFLYVAGGAADTALTQAGLLDTYEWAKVDITLADGSQTVSAFAVGQATAGGNATIGGGRAFLSAYSADHTVKSDIPAGTTYVYFGSGMDKPITTIALKTGMAVGSVTSASTTGDMGTLTTVTASPVGGAGAATIAGFLFTIGGWNSGLAIQNTSSATFCPTTGCSSSPPVLTTWNNGGGGTPNIPRVLLSAVVEAPFIYIFGGSTNSTATNATQSTERTVW